MTSAREIRPEPQEDGSYLLRLPLGDLLAGQAPAADFDRSCVTLLADTANRVYLGFQCLVATGTPVPFVHQEFLDLVGFQELLPLMQPSEPALAEDDQASCYWHTQTLVDGRFLLFTWVANVAAAAAAGIQATFAAEGATLDVLDPLESYERPVLLPAPDGDGRPDSVLARLHAGLAWALGLSEQMPGWWDAAITRQAFAAARATEPPPSPTDLFRERMN